MSERRRFLGRAVPLGAVLVWAGVTSAVAGGDRAPGSAAAQRLSVASVEYLGMTAFGVGSEQIVFEETVVGGLSALSYDDKRSVYYALSDDRRDPRFYTLRLDLRDGSLDAGDVTFLKVTRLHTEHGAAFAPTEIDPEGVALLGSERLFVASEGNTRAQSAPFVNEFDLTGRTMGTLPIPDRYMPAPDERSGVRNNRGFEALCLTPNGETLYTAPEESLFQDGPAGRGQGTALVRILAFDVATRSVKGEFVYDLGPIPVAPDPAKGFANNGLVELLALDNGGTLLALERGFAVEPSGAGNYTVTLQEIDLRGAVDVQQRSSLVCDADVDTCGAALAPGAPFAIDPPVAKRTLFDFEAVTGAAADNIEGMTLGPKLPDGRRILIAVSDDNFDAFAPQATRFYAFALTIQGTATAFATVETPALVDDPDAAGLRGDADDSAIYVPPEDPSESLVITAVKNGGLVVFDLAGTVVQEILPARFGEVRYNNVDVLYGWRGRDLAVVSDRRNDRLVIFLIDPYTRRLTDITNAAVAPIFGGEPGEDTAYGLGAWLDAETGEANVFVTRADAPDVAQLVLMPLENDSIGYRVVRRFRLGLLPLSGSAHERSLTQELEDAFEDAQAEGVVVDGGHRVVYVGQENVGVWRFDVAADSRAPGRLIDTVGTFGGNLTRDVEGLAIYYAGEREGYLLASSQGESLFAVYERGTERFLGKFSIDALGGRDGVEETDGIDVVNVALGRVFPHGLFVAQDGVDEPQVVVQDGAALENRATNFKFVPWPAIAEPLGLTVDSEGFHPRGARLPQQ